MQEVPQIALNSTCFGKMVLGVSRFRRINGNYKIHEKIANGLFGGVYRVTDRNGGEFAAKIVPSKHRVYLQNESDVMPKPQESNQRAPFCHYFGPHGNKHVLVMDLLGESVLDLKTRFIRLCVKSVLLLGIQMISLVESLHNRGYIHRDIIPDNFLIGNYGEDRKHIHLIDYGFAAKFLDSNGQHVPVTMGEPFVNLPDFASRQVHKDEPESRRSDLESIVYVIIYLLKGLPWENVPNTAEGIIHIGNMKENITITELCRGLPSQMKQLYREVWALEYEERPDYERLRSHLVATLTWYQLSMDTAFEWTTGG